MSVPAHEPTRAPARPDRWVWLSLIPFGFGSWAPIIAAVRCRSLRWALLGFVGPAAVIVSLAISPHHSGAANQSRNSLVGLLLIGAWIGGIIASFSIRPAYERERDRIGRERPAYPRPSGRSLKWSPAYGIGAFAMAFGVAAVIGLILRYGIGYHIAVGPGVLLTDAIMLVALVPIARREGLGRADLGIRATPAMRSLGLVILALIAYLIVASVWTVAFIGHSASHESGVLSGVSSLGTFETVLAVLAASVSAPVVEEIFFRGLLYRCLRNRLPVPVAAVTAGMLFGLVHIIGYPLITLPVKAAFGVIACLLYERTGSILPGIALHSFVDATAIDVALTGNDDIVLPVAGLVIVTLIVRAVLPSAAASAAQVA